MKWTSIFGVCQAVILSAPLCGNPLAADVSKEPDATNFNAYVPPFDAKMAGLTPLFDGKTLGGWIGDPD